MIDIHTERKHTVFKVTGEVTANEILTQLPQYMSGKQTDTAIWDFTEAARVKVTTMEIKGIAESLSKLSNDDKARRIALVGSKSINIGLGKLFAAFAEMAGVPNDYKVFRSMDHAIEWVEKKPDSR